MNLPERISEARLLVLVIAKRWGKRSREIDEEIAKGHMRLVYSMTKRYCNAYPNKVEYIRAEALFALAYAIAKPERLKDNNLTPYIIACVHSFVRRYLKKDHTIVIPETTERRHSLSRLRQVSSIEKSYTNSSQDIKELLNYCARDADDILILEMRIKGYRDEEISDKLGKSKSFINLKRKALERRYNELSGY